MLVIYNAILVDRNISQKGYIVCDKDKILSVHKNDGEKPDAAELKTDNAATKDDITYYDAHGLTLMPAFIDMHAHFRYPGQPQKEDLDSGLAAAKNGGFGTLVLMPNTN
ncbi:MAG: amidohydrolase family protein, partial [Treponema sp.]|nr:amidohydrolase family protein [Treponema sp.]